MLVCTGNLAHAQAIAPDAPFLVVSVPTSPDSAVKLARFAMGHVKGAIQPTRVQRNHTLVMTQYTRALHSGAQTQVSLIAAVARKPSATEPLSTTVEFSAWAVEVQPDMSRLTMSGVGRGTTVSSAPRVQGASSAQLQPYRLTRKDAADWAMLEEIMYALLDMTAKP